MFHACAAPYTHAVMLPLAMGPVHFVKRLIWLSPWTEFLFLFLFCHGIYGQSDSRTGYTHCSNGRIRQIK